MPAQALCVSSTVAEGESWGLCYFSQNWRSSIWGLPPKSLGEGQQGAPGPLQALSGWVGFSRQDQRGPGTVTRQILEESSPRSCVSVMAGDWRSAPPPGKVLPQGGVCVCVCFWQIYFLSPQNKPVL